MKRPKTATEMLHLELAASLLRCPLRYAQLRRADRHDPRPVVELTASAAIYTPAGTPLGCDTAGEVRQLVEELAAQRVVVTVGGLAASPLTHYAVHLRRLQDAPGEPPRYSPAIMQGLERQSRMALMRDGQRHLAHRGVWWGATLLEWDPRRSMWLFRCVWNERYEPWNRVIRTFLSGRVDGQVWTQMCAEFHSTVTSAEEELQGRP